MKYLRLSVFLLFFGSIWACSPSDDVDSATQTTEELPLPPDERGSADDVRPEGSNRVNQRSEDTAAVPPSRPPTPRRDPPTEQARRVETVPRAETPRTSSGDVTSRPAPAAPAPEMYTVPAGSPLTVVMTSTVSTATSKEGDTFEASLAEALAADGRIVADRGATVVGRVTEVIQPGKVKGRAELKLVLTEIFAGTRGYKISTEPFVAIAIDNKERDAAIIAGGAGVGAAIGAITGGKRGAAIGAIIGGGGGTATVLATRGQEMKIEPETKVNFVLDDSVRLPVLRERSAS